MVSVNLPKIIFAGRVDSTLLRSVSYDARVETAGVRLLTLLDTCRSFGRLSALGLMFPLIACATPEPPPPDVLPVMQWDHRPEGEQWTEATLAALQTEGVALLSEVPGDIGTWCPGYLEADHEERAAFWAGLLSALARFESTWNPAAVGGGGRWFGLVQISPSTARLYDCAADSGSELTNGSANLQCAVRIAAETVTRDGVVAANRGGLAADWGPPASAEKRQAMAAWVSSQSYCQG